MEPCTVASAAGSFYDLRPLSILPPVEGKKPGKNDKTDDWHARGYDYHDGKANFTLNICAPVIGAVDDVTGVDKHLYQNVSAYYQLGSKTYSIGSGSPSKVQWIPANILQTNVFGIGPAGKKARPAIHGWLTMW